MDVWIGHRATVPAATSSGETSPPAPASSSGPSFAETLRGVGAELDRGERGTRAAIGALRGGGDLTPSELIAVQIGVYRYSDAIDLVSRLVDRATGAVKTVVQGSGS